LTFGPPLRWTVGRSSVGGRLCVAGVPVVVGACLLVRLAFRALLRASLAFGRVSGCRRGRGWAPRVARGARAGGRACQARLQALVSVVFMACLAARGRTSRVGSPCTPCPNSKANSVALDWDGGPLASAVRCTAVGAVRLSMSIVAWCLWAVVFARYRDFSGRQVRHLLSLFFYHFSIFQVFEDSIFYTVGGGPNARG
jgi:hypothetical protein